MAQTRRRSPRPGGASVSMWLYICAVVVTAIVLSAVCWWRFPVGKDAGVSLLVLFLMGVASSRWREEDIGARIGFSFTSIILLASVALVGPAGASLVGMASPALELRRARWDVRLFNTAMMSIIGSLGGVAYRLAGGPVDVGSLGSAWDLVLRVGVPLMVADVCQCLINALVLGGVVGLSQGIPMRRFVPGMLGSSGPAYIGYGVIGYLFVILWIPAEVGPFSAVLVLAPLFVARWAFGQYGDEQRAHERTLSALVTAVETKDPFTRGHSERIAQLCELIAGALSLGQRRTEALRYAGMLHDIGKLGIPARLLHKSAELTDDELAVVAMHPVRGVEMVREIDFLHESVDGILHHHERFDGLGYPQGLSGTEIPEFARIIAVADAFDSLTTARPGRAAASAEEALAVLRARAGSHLDPSIVAALERALSRHEWHVTSADPESWGPVGSSYDHDDPAESDRLALRSDLVRGPAGPADREVRA